MYSRILVAIDGSDTSRHALTHAIELARHLSAALRIVHVADMNWLPLGPELAIDTGALRAVRRDAGERILAAAREAAQHAALEAEVAMIETGSPTQHVAESLVEDAGRWQADLLVVGTHGRRGFKRLLLGSVAEGVTRHAETPVLLIPARDAHADS
jgi:nucleotide-binding universal stress UspA family protein